MSFLSPFSFLPIFSLAFSVLGSPFSASEIASACSSDILEEVRVPSGITAIKSPPNRNAEDKTANTRVISVGEFCLAVNEISVGLFTRCISAGRCAPLRGNQDDPLLPVHSVTVVEIQDFIDWVNHSSGRNYRLPSEAEWQMAAFSGSNHEFPWRDMKRPASYNIFSENISSTNISKANEYGIRDMIGNVAEFVADCFSEDLDLIPQDGTALQVSDCTNVMFKGGAFSTPDYILNPSSRFPVPSDFATPLAGFRLARTIARK
ncbi:SUMF1/EgtB/PvdO family nonheme iron enzyme [Planktotalea sp.]|uniref:formylglycine-generating enzyme family protein n=1 Tax=Planktotalea sp. TaxID=2029877 RepID=UPI00329A429E